MPSFRLRLLCFALASFAALLTAGCSLNAAAAVTLPAPVKLGLAAPVAGPDHAAGNRLQQAVRLAVEERNTRGGVAGRPVELAVHDDHAPNGGALAAQRLASDPAVLAAVGHPGPASSGDAAPVYRERGLAAVLFAPVEAARPQAQPGLLQLAPDSSAVARAAAQFAVAAFGGPAVAVVAGPNPDDTRQAEALRQAAQAAGLRVVHTESLFPASTNYADAVARLAAARPDVLLIAAGMPAAAAFWREAEGTAQGAVVTGLIPGSAPEFAAVAGSAATTAYLPFMQPEPGELADLEAVLEAYRAHWGTEPDAASLLAYDAAAMALEAMERALRHAPTDARAAVRLELDRLRAGGGVTGLLRFDDSGRLEGARLDFARAAPLPLRVPAGP